MKEFNHNKAINAMRYIGLKAIQCAKGGHVGMTISAAPITYTLYTRFIKINPENGKWINRDRFVLSGGHGSMSLYPILYFSGLLTKEDLMNFKQENSKTPGHPEHEYLKDNFIDASTGPLGQGIAMGVGMALAQKIANSKTKKFPLMFDNFTYIVCGDGDFQEGISYEAMAIAGKYKLNKLIVLHDSNKFQLDSSVETVSIENLEQRALSNNWFYQKCSNDPNEIEKAILNAHNSDKPSFIEVETIIAEGLPIQNSAKGHHGVVSDEDLQGFQNHFKTNFVGWLENEKEIFEYFQQNVSQRGLNSFNEWSKELKQYKANNPEEYNQIMNFVEGNIDYSSIFDKVNIEKNNQATRVYLKSYLNSLNNTSPFAIATCADLVASTNVIIGNELAIEGGHNLPIGIREFAMGAVMNGLTLYGPFKVIGGTFLVFADYIKSAIRIGALMELPTIYAFTHDSYQVGGDGPTHQPYDQLPMLRAIEHVNVFRPANEIELKHSMTCAYNSKKDSSVLILTRQNLTSFQTKVSKEEFDKGAYIVEDAKKVDFVIAASGSEVLLALEVAKKVGNTRVVSVPCLNKAVKMNLEEKRQLFGANIALITMEASSDYMWFALHLDEQKNTHLGAYTFGKSMDGEQLYKNKGFDLNKIVQILEKFKK